ncbi:MAG: ABC transporter ATP-binding protein [Oscillospiraceae bacterium]|nr:ABC transporter ATP-binding protein [Oscillospiraceae bacterium]
MNTLEIKHLSKSFPGFQLDNISLTLPSGCVMGLVGENGAGKSTTIKLILEMLRRDGGTVTILGKDSVQLVKEDIGVVMDEVGIPLCLNTRQVGKVMAGSYQNWDQARYEALLQKLSLPDKKPFKDFSRGMKMKLGIAIALSHNAKLLILDEATSGLDPVVRDEVVEMFREFTMDESHAILISSHIVSDLEKLCDYIAFLHQGKLLLCEEKDRLLEEYGLVLCTPEQLMELDADTVKGTKKSPYGIEALVLRENVPAGWKVSPVSIEDLFIFMVKEAK